MRIQQKTITLYYKVFDAGEVVRPTSARAALGPGDYTVTAYHEPAFPDSEGTVFLAGHPYGFGTEFLAPATDVHPLSEPPPGFVALAWDNTSVGQEVWLWGTHRGQPHAYGPLHVVSPPGRELLNIGRQCFSHPHQDLLVRAPDGEELP